MSTEAGARERRLAEELIDRLLQDLASVGRSAGRSGHKGNERGNRHRGQPEERALPATGGGQRPQHWSAPALLFYRGQT